jgi:hypothetical protein
MSRCFVAVLCMLAITQAKAAPDKYYNSEKTIIIIVGANGMATIGKDTLTSEQLTEELQKRLWKSYLGTGKMYDSISLRFTDEVMITIKTAIKKAIQEGQNKALTDVCLQKHKKLFEDLNNSQQAKIRKQFPVLFQKDY